MSWWAGYADGRTDRTTISCVVGEKVPRICKTRFSAVRAVHLLDIGEKLPRICKMMKLSVGRAVHLTAEL